MNKYNLYEKPLAEILDIIRRGDVDFESFEYWYNTTLVNLAQKKCDELMDDINSRLESKFDEGYDEGHEYGYSDGYGQAEMDYYDELKEVHRKAYDQGFEAGYERGFNNAKQMENKGC